MRNYIYSVKEKRYISTREGLLYSIELKLISEDNARFTTFTGYLIKGLITSMIQKYDIRLSKDLEIWRGIKPYSVTPIISNVSKKQGDLLKIRANDVIRFRVLSFEEEIINRVMDAISSKKRCKIGDYTFLIEDCVIDRYDLVDFINTQYHTNLLNLEFYTPTAFSTMAMRDNIPFPMPNFLFSNLAKLWNENLPDDAQINLEELTKWIGNNVFISDYKTYIKTIEVKRNRTIKGFQGYVKYKIRSLNNYGAWIWALARLGEIFGTGIKRTIGMGRYRIVNRGY